MDMELVAKNGIIYPVQARPVNRPETLPSYLDWQKINAPLRRVPTEMFLPGSAEVLKNLKPDEILIDDTLANAEKKFKKDKHRLVIVYTPEESTNSHPIVNFSSLGIPCFYKENISEVNDLISNSELLAACTQTGELVAWDQKIPIENCISKGYAVHPAKLAVSVAPYPLPKVPSAELKKEVSQDVKQLLNKIRSTESEQIALDAIKALKPTSVEKISATSPETMSEKLVDSSNRVTTAMNRALSELKATIKQKPEQRLHRLLHAKVIENLQTQKAAAGSLGNLSILDVSGYQEAAARIKSYKEKQGPSSLLHDEIILEDYMMTPEQKIDWEVFISSLENNRNIQRDKIIQFKSLLAKLQKFQIVPLWMARFFVPTVNDKTKSLEDCLDEFIKLLTPESEMMIGKISHLQDEISDFQNNLERFSEPKKAAAAIESLGVFFEKLDANNKDCPLKEIFNGSNPLVRIYTLKMMEAAIDLYDKSIKKMKGSSEINDQLKAEYFHQMLLSFFKFFESVTQISGQYLVYHPDFSLKTYLFKLESILMTSSNKPETFFPSRNFNVSSVILGYASAMSRSLPVTKEDIFTLIHQSLLFSRQVLLGNEMKEKIQHPEIVEKTMKELETIKQVKLSGYQFPPGKMVLTYNYPLRSHSAMVEIHYDRETQKCALHVHFLGRARSRWKAFSHILIELNKKGILLLAEDVKVDPMQLHYSLKLNNEETITMAVKTLLEFGVASLSQDYRMNFLLDYLFNIFRQFDKQDCILSDLLEFTRKESYIENFDDNYNGSSTFWKECFLRLEDPANVEDGEKLAVAYFTSPRNLVDNNCYYFYEQFCNRDYKKLIEMGQKFSQSESNDEKLTSLMIDCLLNDHWNPKECLNKFLYFSQGNMPVQTKKSLLCAFLKQGQLINNLQPKDFPIICEIFDNVLNLLNDYEILLVQELYLELYLQGYSNDLYLTKILQLKDLFLKSYPYPKKRFNLLYYLTICFQNISDQHISRFLECFEASHPLAVAIANLSNKDKLAQLICEYINDPSNKLSVEQAITIISNFIDISTQKYEPAPEF